MKQFKPGDRVRIHDVDQVTGLETTDKGTVIAGSGEAGQGEGG